MKVTSKDTWSLSTENPAVLSWSAVSVTAIPRQHYYSGWTMDGDICSQSIEIILAKGTSQTIKTGHSLTPIQQTKRKYRKPSLAKVIQSSLISSSSIQNTPMRSSTRSLHYGLDTLSQMGKYSFTMSQHTTKEPEEPVNILHKERSGITKSEKDGTD